MFAIALLRVVSRANFVPALWSLGLSIMGISYALFFAMLLAALYLGIEPLVRRNFPDALISLSRLQGGRFRDSLVASHVLAGLAVFGLLQAVAFPLRSFVPDGLESPLYGIASLSALFGFEMYRIGYTVLMVAGFCLFLVLVRLALLPLLKDRVWIADLLAILPFTLPDYFLPGSLTNRLIMGAFLMLAFSLMLWAVRRYGLLSAAVILIAIGITGAAPLVIPSWWSGRVLLQYAIPPAAGAWALWAVLSDKRGRSTETAG